MFHQPRLRIQKAQIAGNIVSNNSGWGISLWHSSHSIITRNAAHHNVRCESPRYRRGCDSAPPTPLN